MLHHADRYAIIQNNSLGKLAKASMQQSHLLPSNEAATTTSPPRVVVGVQKWKGSWYARNLWCTYQPNKA